MELAPAPLELMLSKNAAMALAVKAKASVPASTQPGHFLQEWRIDVADNLMGSKAFLVTNLVTLFTFVIPQEPQCSLKSVSDTFLMRLRLYLLAANPPVEWRPSQIVAVRGNPRAVIGSMNDMIAMMTYRRDVENFNGTEAEEFLNDTPFSIIGMESPQDRGIQQLNSLNR